MDHYLTEPQSEFFQSQAKYVAAVAGYGSGKTEASLVKMFDNMARSPGMDQAYLAPTYPLIRDIWYPKVEEFFTKLGVKYEINKGEHNIYVQGFGTIFCRSMEKPENIVGWQCSDAFLDEFDILPHNKALVAFRKISARLRQKNPNKKNQLFITTTPEGFKATHHLFKKEPLPNSHLIQMSTYSNESNLPEGYIDDLREQYPPQLIEAYLEGEFVNLTSGSVYSNFDRSLNDTRYVAKPREILHIGMDFNVYNMAAVIHVIRENAAYAVDELTGIKDTPTMCELLSDQYPEHQIVVYPDASGNSVTTKGASVSDIKILQKNRFRISAPAKNPFIRDRVNSVNARICDPDEKRHYFVNTQRCPMTADCLEQQVYDDNGMPSKDEGHDHSNDALGYFIHRYWPLDRMRHAYRKKAANWK